MIPLPLRRPVVAALIAAAGSFSLTCSAEAAESYAPAPVVPLASEPAPRLHIDMPLAAQLANGLVVIRYRTENIRIVPASGPAAIDVSPRIGHLHITVDDAPWHWADASGEPIIIQGLTAGPHRVLLQLADPTHKVIESKTVELVIRQRRAGHH